MTDGETKLSLARKHAVAPCFDTGAVQKASGGLPRRLQHDEAEVDLLDAQRGDGIDPDSAHGGDQVSKESGKRERRGCRRKRYGISG